MKPIGVDGFDAMFRVDPDPWNYAASPFEQWKRGVLLHACGDRIRGRVLELACANGETTLALRPKSLRLLSVDGSSAALEAAAERTKALDRTELRQAVLPREMPRGSFDLVVVSELLYYLEPRSLTGVLDALARRTAAGGRVVLLHHQKRFDDAAVIPAQVHAMALRRLSPSFALRRRDRLGRFEVIALDRMR